MNTYISYGADVEKMGLYRGPFARYRPASIGAVVITKRWKVINAGVLEEVSDGS